MSSNYENFSQHFLDEVLKLCFFKKDFCSVVCQHFSYEMVPVDLKGYKIIFKRVISYFESTSKLPTIGMITQTNQIPEVYEIIDRVNKVKLPDLEETLNTLEGFIKRVKFQKLYSEIAEMYNNGNQEGAIEHQATESIKIVNFSIKGNTSYMEDVFEGFHRRDEERFRESLDTTKALEKVPFGIDLLDDISHGGSEVGDTDCFLGRSGSGKTKWLRWRGVSAARRGFRVLHIQGEGTKKQCELGYDATWTSIFKRELSRGDISPELMKRLDKVINDIRNRNGGIKIVAFEQFETATMRDVRKAVLDYYKIEGCFPHLILLDYLELFDPGDGKRYSASTDGEKMRREASARKFKNICNEFGIRGATGSQANDIPPSDFNRSDFVMTRHNVAGAKGLPDSFSFFFTWNVTGEEYNKDMGRLYCDKLRDHKGNQTVRLCTAFDHDRFYDRVKTLRFFEEDYKL